MRLFQSEEHKQLEREKLKLNARFELNQKLVPLDYILKITNDYKERRLKYQKKIEKERRQWKREQFWKNFNPKLYAFHMLAIYKFKATILYKEIITFIKKIKLFFSLAQEEKELIKGYKAERLSDTYLQYLLKNRISAKEIEEVNSKLILMPE